MAILHVKTPNGTTQTLNLSNVVTSVVTGSSNGTISVNGTNVAVKGLGTAAYTASTAYAAASHGNHVPATQTASNKVFLRNDNTWQTVTPANIGAAAASHGNHIPSGGASGQFLGWSSAGAAKWVANPSVNNIPASSVNANGYVRFNNGVIIQWFRANLYNSANGKGEGYITFPIAFGTVYRAVLTHMYISTAVVNDPKSLTITAMENNQLYAKAYNVGASGIEQPSYTITVDCIVIGRT